MKTIRKISVILIIFSIIIGVSSFSSASTYEPRVMQSVRIYINSIEFITDKDIYNFNGTTLVPMRAIFEKLGAEIIWEDATKTVFAETKDTSVELTIDRKTAKKDGKNIVLLVEPKLINKTTYIPLRFVAEAFNYEVDWNGTNSIISLIDLSEVAGQEGLKIYESSSFFKDDYIRMEILENKEIIIQGITGLDKTNWMFNVEGKDELKIWEDIKFNNTYEKTVNLKDNLREGDYKVGVYFKGKNDSSYWSYYWKIPLKFKEGEMFFPISPVYENNYLKSMINSVIDPEYYLDVILASDRERKEISDLANNIIKGIESDYEKALKISEWISQNIYYDWDGYLTGVYGRTDAYGTLESRKSVCQGYAELTNVLLRSVGIPSRLVTGHALGVSASGGFWNDVDHTKSNHAWNEAFVDNRWITIDTTWNSGNKYESEVFIQKDMGYRYFDPNLEVFSYTHKILGIR